MIQIYHPDKNLDNPDYDSSKFFQVFEAYETLNDEEKEEIQPFNNNSKPEIVKSRLLNLLNYGIVSIVLILKIMLGN